MGPLTACRVLELPSIGPTQFAGMALGDLGAEVLRLDRATSVAVGQRHDARVAVREPRPQPALDGHRPEAPARRARSCSRCASRADVLIEGFRPGVAERLGIGPDVALAPQPAPRLRPHDRLGPGRPARPRRRPRHQLHRARRRARPHRHRPAVRPSRPINLVGDFGGGGLLLAFGVLAALLERERSGQGQVIDAAMVDGAAMLMSVFVGLSAMGFWSDDRGTNLLDGGAHFYGVYETVRRRVDLDRELRAAVLRRAGRGCSVPLGIDARPGDADGPGARGPA